mgnify:CR=1 FL=1
MIIPVGLGKDSYDIVIERGALGKAAEIFDLDRKVMIVTDSQVPEKYYLNLAAGCKVSVAGIFQAGEASKSPQNFLNICKKMMREGFSRKDCVVAVGGGVAGDMAGFAAACYMRGIDFYNVPTTLLSQVDSSVGGKTAVDLDGVKNIIGAFHQPRGVIIDPDVLETLSPRQFACGTAEIIKIAACMDVELFGRIEREGIAGNPRIEEIIAAAVTLKARVVEEDEKEKGIRRVLNFGHTLGHGIETVTGLYHGECVSLGMLPMCRPAVRERIKKILEREGLPVRFSEAAPEPEKVIEAAMHDKKAEGGSIVTVRLDDIGSFKFEAASEEQLMKDYLEVFG